jgi:hypothetical protein
MSNLDEKLRGIKIHPNKIVFPDHDNPLPAYAFLDDEAIAQIKQLFADEGYTKTNAQFYAAYAAEKKKLLRQGVMRLASNSVGQISDLAARRAAGLGESDDK